MENKINYKSHMNIYWTGFYIIIASVILVNLFIVKEFKNFSFEFYFLMLIPLWFSALGINNHETERIKKTLREYLSNSYPEKLKEYDQKPVELLNSDTEDILDLFADEELIKDPAIKMLSVDSKKVTYFLYSVFLLTPLLLVTTVFLILKW
jgi:hypothetical protein